MYGEHPEASSSREVLPALGLKVSGDGVFNGTWRSFMRKIARWPLEENISQVQRMQEVTVNLKGQTEE